MKKIILILVTSVSLLIYSCGQKYEDSQEYKELNQKTEPLSFKVIGKYMEVSGRYSNTSYYLIDSNRNQHRVSPIDYAITEKNDIFYQK